ncbi:MAG: response regulator [Elusimicrobiota bacterium]
MKKKILIVEDEELIAQVLRMRLEHHGYQVVVAHDGEEGLSMARKEHPDLAILDIGLPFIDGDSLRKLIKSEPATKGVKVIMLTGHAFAGDTTAEGHSAAEIYIRKPFEWKHLLGHVNKILGQAA